MMKCRKSIEFHGFDLDVEYEYEPYSPAKITADPYDSQEAEGGWCEIYKIELCGQDISDLIGEERVNELCELIEKIQRDEK